MNISVELSRRGVDSGAGNPPPTNQRKIRTRACCRSGEVLRVAGSLVSEEGRSGGGILPLGSLERRRELSEFILYIRPVIRNRPSSVEAGLPGIPALHSRFFREPQK
ncbi:hypothetical protein [Salinispira pacifica]|uniref:Uncharacterized protein n=1 Tax=Salinispira pacifica TaxID=1307761 RepID=V5WCP6_9SPIO|nr:hypothetical protein [Salinispira pacifica]AHC13542.1 hypothetical protein L21SP2_0098 [Salinispira pacifica]